MLKILLFSSYSMNISSCLKCAPGGWGISDENIFEGGKLPIKEFIDERSALRRRRKNGSGKTLQAYCKIVQFGLLLVKVWSQQNTS